MAGAARWTTCPTRYLRDACWATGLPSTRAANPRTEEAAAAGQPLIVTLRQGLHARPAALLAQRAKSFGAQASLSAHGRTANARSVVAIMALGVRQGDELSIQASGADAPQSVASLVAGIQEALRMESAAGHGAAEGTAPDSSKTAPTAAPRPLAAAGVLGGVIAVAGIAVGRATRIERREIAVAEHGADSGRERAELEQARINVRMRLE